MRFLAEAAALVEAPESVRIYDPAPHLITRRAGYERARLLMQSASRPALQNFLGDLTKCLFEKAPRDIRWHLDVDPIEFD
jgi:primosomal protein N' (replication factor Y) (superfamily II helicase)